MWMFLLSRARLSITLIGECVEDLWTAQNSATCWRRASTQAAHPVWDTRTRMTQTSHQKKRSLQPARASLTLSLCVAITVWSIPLYIHLSLRNLLSIVCEGSSIEHKLIKFINVPALPPCSRLTLLHQRKPITLILCLLLTTLLPTHILLMPPHRVRECSMMTSEACMWGILHINIHTCLYSLIKSSHISNNLMFQSFQGRACGDDEDTQAQDDELSLSANEIPQGSDGGESFTLELQGQPQDQPLNLDHGLNPDYCQPPLDFLDPNCLPR